MTAFGVNFRANDTFVTDGADETYCVGDVYPTTRAGATFGWDSAFGNVRDRDAGNDRRLAGITFVSFGSHTFRLDLPATGSYDIRLALGDHDNAQTHDAVLKDDTTTIATFSSVSTGANQFADAQGTVHTAANWPTNNVAITHTFASTVLILELGSGGSPASCIAHLSIASGGGTPQLLRPIADIATGSWTGKIEQPETVRNLLNYTESLDNAYWTKANSSISANSLGTLDKIVEDTSGSSHVVAVFVTPTPSANYVFSGTAKPAGRDWIYVEIFRYTGGGLLAWFDLVNGVVGTTTGTVTTSIVPDPEISGAFRWSVGGNVGSGGFSPFLQAAPADADGNATYTGNGSSGIHVGKLQFETGLTPSTYQPIVATDPPTDIVDTATLYETVDETSADDTDFAVTHTPNDTCKLLLTPLPDPESDSGHVLRFRSSAEEFESVQASLYCGNTLIASFTEILTTMTTYSHTLSGSQADSITDYSNLRVWLTSLVGSPTPVTYEVRVSWIEFETPSGTATVRLVLDPFSFGAGD